MNTLQISMWFYFFSYYRFNVFQKAFNKPSICILQYYTNTATAATTASLS